MSYNARPYLFFDGSASVGFTSDATIDAPWRYANFYDKFVFCHASTPPQYWDGSRIAYPIPGLPNGVLYDGVVAFARRLVFWKDDLLTFSDATDHSCYIPVSLSAGVGVFPLTGFFLQQAVGVPVAISVKYAIGAGPTTGSKSSEFTPGPFTAGQYFRIDDLPYVNFYQLKSVSEVVSNGAVVGYTLSAVLLDKTGATPVGMAVSDALSVQLLPPNEAGEIPVVGEGSRNGPILNVVPLGDKTAMIFKNRWVGQLQYVGRENGVFSIDNAINDDGLIGPNAVAPINNSTIVFLGNKELYEFSPGTEEPLKALARQATRQLFEDLDRSKLGFVRIFHNSERNEYWVLYPSLTTSLQPQPSRIFIYNYLEKTATIDDYHAELGYLGGIARLPWEQFPAWSADALNQPVAWQDDTGNWDSDSSDFESATVVIMNAVPAPGVTEQGQGNPHLYVHGHVYDRGGLPIHSEVQTIDFDFGDNVTYKYLDTVYLGVQIKNRLTGVNRLLMEAGGRDNLDSDIRWSGTSWLDVSGNATTVAKINIRRSGRYLRVKFYSEQVGLQWRISSFRLIARKGGGY